VFVLEQELFKSAAAFLFEQSVDLTLRESESVPEMQSQILG
jgi:hypothetical protein